MPNTKDFSFTKIWRSDEGQNVSWPKSDQDEDIPITVTLNAYTADDPAVGVLADMTFTLSSSGALTGSDTETAWSVLYDPDTNLYSFTLTGLKKWTDTGKELIYYLSEERCSDWYHDPVYAFMGTGDGGSLLEKTDGRRALDQEYIINTSLKAYALPNTG